ncbi:hypothetical protein [Niallia circulans]|nr:hypothetical protein [Niallia circulans]
MNVLIIFTHPNKESLNGTSLKNVLEKMQGKRLYKRYTAFRFI